MTSIEHINYRHAFESGFEGVSKFAESTSARDTKGFVDEALTEGTISTDASSVFHDIGRVIGTDRFGNPVSGIQIYIRDGIIRTASPN